MNVEKQFISWANLVDLGFASALANLKTEYGARRAIKEINRSLRRQSQQHWQALIATFKRLR